MLTAEMRWARDPWRRARTVATALATDPVLNGTHLKVYIGGN